jgi:hypothetical protein
VLPGGRAPPWEPGYWPLRSSSRAILRVSTGTYWRIGDVENHPADPHDLRSDTVGADAVPELLRQVHHLAGDLRLVVQTYPAPARSCPRASPGWGKRSLASGAPVTVKMLVAEGRWVPVRSEARSGRGTTGCLANAPR